MKVYLVVCNSSSFLLQFIVHFQYICIGIGVGIRLCIYIYIYIFIYLVNNNSIFVLGASNTRNLNRFLVCLYI